MDCQQPFLGRDNLRPPDSALSVTASDVCAKLKLPPRGKFTETAFVEVSPQAILEAQPVRRFRQHRGQKHFSGRYWCATTGTHIVYESLLELTRLQLADFDPEVRGICAQPFQISGKVNDRARRHVPDFFLARTDGSFRVINVKTEDHLGDPKVGETLEWASMMFASRGWAHEIWTGASPELVRNVRFLAGYRRDWLFEGELLTADELERVNGLSITEAERVLVSSRPEGRCRPVLLNALWKGRLLADLNHLLSSETRVEASNDTLPR